MFWFRLETAIISHSGGEVFVFGHFIGGFSVNWTSFVIHRMNCGRSARDGDLFTFGRLNSPLLVYILCCSLRQDEWEEELHWISLNSGSSNSWEDVERDLATEKVWAWKTFTFQGELPFDRIKRGEILDDSLFCFRRE